MKISATPLHQANIKHKLHRECVARATRVDDDVRRESWVLRVLEDVLVCLLLVNDSSRELWYHTPSVLEREKKIYVVSSGGTSGDLSASSVLRSFSRSLRRFFLDDSRPDLRRLDLSEGLSWSS